MITLFLTGIFYPQNIAMTALAGILIKFGSGMQSGIATVILADVVDYGEYKLKGHEKYVRVKCSDIYGRTAWTNPIYLDERQI